MLRDMLTIDFDPDSYPDFLVVLKSQIKNYSEESKYHSHSKAQLILPIKGSVQSNIEGDIWVAPLGSALWIPSYVYHNSLISEYNEVCMVFINRSILGEMPEKACVIYTSPLIKELVLYLSQQKIVDQLELKNQKLGSVLVDQLSNMLPTSYNFSLPTEDLLREVALEWFKKPTKYKYISDMAYRCSVSDKTLSRKIKKNIGMSFSDWKKQLHIVVSLQKLYEGYSVDWVSDYLGYESTSTFVTFFKRIFKCSPKRYVKNYCQNNS
ncbi:helix-turn-helix transcriptional regulator [Francisella sp. 19X1-34]|uniref:AraC family transcriptional regulator n=1 Tax=Francisella sp. 19X1-34 TaxID=3087177 RepID=UPI002E300CD7|nr:helix-turn-helix transcriptional regulator [Francisella sp. 19X1-34]MED7788748.1 helix-turn-helix transcriptional regulator [Francisella sp. 19X1-34]